MDEPICSVEWCQNRHHQFWTIRDIPSRMAVGGTSSDDVCVCPLELKGDPDIAGIGVISAFIASAGLTLVWAAICLLLSRRGRGDDAVTPRSQSQHRENFNPIDRRFRDTFCGPARSFVACIGLDPDVLGECFYDGVIALGDQQLATGLGMLVAAAIRTFNSDAPLSVYHLGVITELAWFSSNCHLLALIVIRSYDDSAKPWSATRKERDYMRRMKCNIESRTSSNSENRTSSNSRNLTSSKITRLFRVLLMVVMAGLLLWLSWLSGDGRFYDMYQCPAVCLVNSVDEKAGEPRKWLIVNFFYVIYNYPIAIVVLSTTVRDIWMNVASLRIYTNESQQQETECSHSGVWRTVFKIAKLVDNYTNEFQQRETECGRSGVWRAVFKIAKLVGEVVRRLWVFQASETCDILEVGAWFGLGIWWIFEDRHDGHEVMAATGDEAQVEDSMGFGQLLPIFLLILPLIQFCESYAKHSTEPEIRSRAGPEAVGGSEEASDAQHPAGRGEVGTRVPRTTEIPLKGLSGQSRSDF